MLARILVPVLAICGVTLGQEPAQPESPPAKPASPPAEAAPQATPVQPSSDPARQEKPLTVGDPAPPLTISRWLKGDPISQLAPGHVYVVEFWATWCAPCRRSLETLSKLQASHDPARLTVIGVCGTDTHGETVPRIESFVTSREGRLQQRIALDDEAATRADWLGGARIVQIPAAFVVAGDGRIAWIGNPATAAPALQRTVDQLLAGTFDFERAKFSARAEATRRAEIEAKGVELQVKLRQAMQENDYELIATIIDALIRLDPDRYSRLAVSRFQALLVGMGRADNAYDYARELLADRLRDDPMGLQALAWAILEGPNSARATDLALTIATRANELMEGDDAVILDTLACAQFQKGDIDAAIATQTKAVDKAPKGKVAQEMTKTLTKYKAAKKP